MQDKNFYVDESVRILKLNKHGKTINLIGAGIGIKNEDVQLLDWCGIAFYKPNGSNGNGYWTFLGRRCLDLIFLQDSKYKPEKIYVCNQIAFYIAKAALSFNLEEINKLIEKFKPVTHKGYKEYNSIYKTKQKVGKLVRSMLRMKISQENILKILQGKLYDLKIGELFEINL